MESVVNSLAIIVLAAGDGTRMKSSLPKVMNLLAGRPIIDHIVGTIEKTKLVAKPILVVSGDHNLVQGYLGDRANYVIQAKPLGTGHAVAVTEDTLKDQADHIVVLYGDMPFISADSIKRLVEQHIAGRHVFTLATFTVPSFDDHNHVSDFSRIIRDSRGAIIKDVQAKDATAEELKATELNPGVYCFDAPWLWAHLKLVRNSNAQKEYYLTDLVALAIQSGFPVGSVSIDPQEAIGINSKDHLELAKKLAHTTLSTL